MVSCAQFLRLAGWPYWSMANGRRANKAKRHEYTQARIDSQLRFGVTRFEDWWRLLTGSTWSVEPNRTVPGEKNGANRKMRYGQSGRREDLF